MDEENLKSWVAQPDVCRCCLSSSGTWDMTTLYVTDVGVKQEIFADMLEECYGITLSHLSEWGPSHLICELCLGHLRDASSFRKQVLKAEAYFTEYFKKNKSEPSVKHELGESEYCDDNPEGGTITDNKKLHKPKTECDLQCEEIKTKPENRKRRNTVKPKMNKVDSDSDVANADLTKIKQSTDENIKGAEDILENYTKKLKKDEEANQNSIQAEPSVKHELEESEYCDDNPEDETITDDEILQEPKTESELQCEEITKAENTKCTREIRKTVKSKKKKVYSNSYSDVAIAELTNKNQSTDENMRVADEILENYAKRLKKVTEVNKNSSKGPLHVAPKNCVKQISEQQRIKLTCDTILSDTTACPFRFHKSWFQCLFCTDAFIDVNSLRCHLFETHQDVEAELRKKKYYPRSLQIDISNLECRHCRVSLTDMDSMRRHFESVHNKTIYNEYIADYKINSSPYSCHLCKQEFDVFKSLTMHLNERHMLNYTGVKPYKCTVCGKGYEKNFNLRKHMRAHDSDAVTRCLTK